MTKKKIDKLYTLDSQNFSTREQAENLCTMYFHEIKHLMAGHSEEQRIFMTKTLASVDVRNRINELGNTFHLLFLPRIINERIIELNEVLEIIQKL